MSYVIDRAVSRGAYYVAGEGYSRIELTWEQFDSLLAGESIVVDGQTIDPSDPINPVLPYEDYPIDSSDPLQRLTERGGPGSGHRGHKGRPGKVGGSQPDSGGPVQLKEGFHRGGAWNLIRPVPSTDRWNPIREAMAAADSVHFAPVPDGYRRIPYRETRALGKGGTFRWSRTGGPLDIQFNLQMGTEYSGNFPMLNAVHEYGHYTDMMLGAHATQNTLGQDYIKYGFGSNALSGQQVDDSALGRAWMELGEATIDSEGIQQLRTFDRFRWTDSEGYQHELQPSSRHRLTTSTEIFARSYVQWVALRSGNEELRMQVQGWREAWRDGGGPDLQWDDDDFTPIASAMDNLFESAGLLK